MLWMWELDCKEGWAPKNWCFWTVVLEETLESPLDCKIKPVSPKENQSWIFIGRTEAEVPILWPCDVKSWLIGTDPDAGKDWRQMQQRMRWLDSITYSIDMNLSKLWEIVEDRGAWHAAVHVVAKNWTPLSNWTTVGGLNITQNPKAIMLGEKILRKGKKDAALIKIITISQAEDNGKL